MFEKPGLKDVFFYRFLKGIKKKKHAQILHTYKKVSLYSLSLSLTTSEIVSAIHLSTIKFSTWCSRGVTEVKIHYLTKDYALSDVQCVSLSQTGAERYSLKRILL